MNPDIYLDCLGLRSCPPTLDFLNNLIAAHHRVISFNNLAVYYGNKTEVNLDSNFLFTKVILEGKGGYCFENNKIFYILLGMLGFKVKARLGRVVYNKKIDVARTHRTTTVEIDGAKYLADVGFGAYAPAQAIPLSGEVIDCYGLDYFITKSDRVYELRTIKNGDDFIYYTFDDGIHTEADFNVANYFSSTHKSAKFVNELVLARKDCGAVEFIANGVYTFIDGERRIDNSILNDEDLNFYLKKFNINESYSLNI